ncbi:hypothetical protein IQ266_13535 [filamentous cyanobacterium LEGE 11480]|uniref:Uncharacterized protein n=1 Tax=Romeriopsis navalis LEGE 11480 TaxID=2777977 RepID=A0A928Z3J7_9CYAN|nr:hypothetical protein [Romeriopsis navalis LEGE 11480]
MNAIDTESAGGAAISLQIKGVSAKLPTPQRYHNLKVSQAFQRFTFPHRTYSV